MRLPMLLGTETLISILLSTSHTCKACSCLLGLYLHYSLCPFLVPSHPSCISPNVSVIEAFRDATCYSSAWVTLSPAHRPVYSAIIAEVCAFTVYHHSNAHWTVKGELLSFAHHYIQASWNTCWMTEWKSGRNWLGACQWPTGRSGLGSHGKHGASSMITSGKRRWGKLRGKLERRKWGRKK